jgi:hypothetical protein
MTDKEALKRIAEKLRRAGASLPAPELTGTIEGSVVTGLCIALALVETEIEALAQPEQEQQIETLKRCLFQMQEAAKDLVEQAKSLTPPQRTEQEPKDWKTPLKEDAPLVKWAKEQTAPQRTEQEPVAWGFQNTVITGSNRWMMLREEVPSNDQYGGALWIPLYTHPPQRTEPTCPECKAEVLYECVACSSNNYPPQPEQEPVAYPDGDVVGPCVCGSWPGGKCLKCPRITTPPQRTWVGLTDEEIDPDAEQSDNYAAFYGGVRFAEAKLKEKNT